MRFLFPLICLLLSFFACDQTKKEVSTIVEVTNTAKGKLFIIGGGKRPPELIQQLIDVSGIEQNGYAIILPMSSAEPDTAAFYAIQQFEKQGLLKEKFISFFLEKGKVRSAQLDSLRNAQLIYLTGGDQRRFMNLVEDTEVPDAIRSAYDNGTTIAGTSAGAALMSRKMITGDEFKHPEYTGNFRTIEGDNMEIIPGLGLLPNAIVDQHFVYRMRMNRLMTVVIEHPEQTGIGIDESTAIIVNGDTIQVAGEGQVVVLKNPENTKRERNGLLGAEGMDLSVLLSGDKFEY